VHTARTLSLVTLSVVQLVEVTAIALPGSGPLYAPVPAEVTELKPACACVAGKQPQVHQELPLQRRRGCCHCTCQAADAPLSGVWAGDSHWLVWLCGCYIYTSWLICQTLGCTICRRSTMWGGKRCLPPAPNVSLRYTVNWLAPGPVRAV